MAKKDRGHKETKRPKKDKAKKASQKVSERSPSIAVPLHRDPKP